MKLHLELSYTDFSPLLILSHHHVSILFDFYNQLNFSTHLFFYFVIFLKFFSGLWKESVITTATVLHSDC